MAKNQSRVYGYARVSTLHQNTDRQIQALEKYGIPKQDIFVDKQSGKNFERQGYLLLKENVLRSGDTLVVKELDRLGRNKEAVKEELEHFKSRGIRVKILDVPTTLIDCEGQDWVMDMVSNILSDGELRETQTANYFSDIHPIDCAVPFVNA